MVSAGRDAGMGKRRVEPIDAERVRLRLLERADLPTTLAWRNQDHVRRCFFDDRRLSWDDHVAWFNQYERRDDDFVFVVEPAGLAELASAPNRPIGQVALYGIDWQQDAGECGRLILADEDRSKGLATEATIALLRAAFAVWGLRRVVANIRADNGPSLRLFARCGFGLVSANGDRCRMEATPETLARPPVERPVPRAT